jgi:hypothetical protein
MIGVEPEGGRGPGQRLPERPQKGGDGPPEESPRGRNERSFRRLDALRQRGVGQGDGGPRDQGLDQGGERRQIDVAGMLLAEAPQARLGAVDIPRPKPSQDLVDEERVTAVHEEIELLGHRPVYPFPCWGG